MTTCLPQSADEKARLAREALEAATREAQELITETILPEFRLAATAGRSAFPDELWHVRLNGNQIHEQTNLSHYQAAEIALWRQGQKLPDILTYEGDPDAKIFNVSWCVRGKKTSEVVLFRDVSTSSVGLNLASFLRSIFQL